MVAEFHASALPPHLTLEAFIASIGLLIRLIVISPVGCHLAASAHQPAATHQARRDDKAFAA
jgi:hypothetical protein